MRRSELFPADRGLQLRMAGTAIATPLVVLALLAAFATTASTTVLIGLAFVVVLGAYATSTALRRDEGVRPLGRDEAPELHATLDRLCALADLPRPDVALDDDPTPNSWIVDLPGRRPRLHVTRGLLDLLTPAELAAVVAHELSHVAHRDATVMSVVGLPGTVLRQGSGDFAWGWWPFMLASLVARGLGWVSHVGTSALSRYREIAADAAAARLTGNPAALASALMKVSGELRLVPREDLREVAARNAFNLLPAGAERWRLTATHPPVAERVAALERLEAQLHAARRRGAAGGAL